MVTIKNPYTNSFSSLPFTLSFFSFRFLKQNKSFISIAKKKGKLTLPLTRSFSPKRNEMNLVPFEKTKSNCFLTPQVAPFNLHLPCFRRFNFGHSLLLPLRGPGKKSNNSFISATPPGDSAPTEGPFTPYGLRSKKEGTQKNIFGLRKGPKETGGNFFSKGDAQKGANTSTPNFKRPEVLRPKTGQNKLNAVYNQNAQMETGFTNSGPNFQKKVVSITYEEIGLFPRSFNRVFDRFLKQVFSDVENLVLQEYRFYRYLFLTTLKTLFILFFFPFLVNVLTKTYIIRPLTEYFWNNQQTEIFLNSYQQKRAFTELEDFEEKLFFESLIYEQKNSLPSLNNKQTIVPPKSNSNEIDSNFGPVAYVTPIPFSFKEGKQAPTATLLENKKISTALSLEQNRAVTLADSDHVFSYLLQNSSKELMTRDQVQEEVIQNAVFSKSSNNFEKTEPPFAKAEGPCPKEGGLSFFVPYGPKSFLALQEGEGERQGDDFFVNTRQQLLQKKLLELAIYYNDYSIEAITNFFADLFTLITLFYLLYSLEIQINITKSFLLEIFFGLDDSKKSLLILLITDLLVGYHSPNIWELFFEFIFHHYGIPESQTVVFLLVATLPVLLDVLFKYLIFRHLNRSSPATVATYHAMIE